MTDYHQLRELRSDLRDCRAALEQVERERVALVKALHEIYELDRFSASNIALAALAWEQKSLSANKETDQSD